MGEDFSFPHTLGFCPVGLHSIFEICLYFPLSHCDSCLSPQTCAACCIAGHISWGRRAGAGRRDQLLHLFSGRKLSTTPSTSIICRQCAAMCDGRQRASAVQHLRLHFSTFLLRCPPVPTPHCTFRKLKIPFFTSAHFCCKTILFQAVPQIVVTISV